MQRLNKLLPRYSNHTPKVDIQHEYYYISDNELDYVYPSYSTEAYVDKSNSHVALYPSINNALLSYKNIKPLTELYVYKAINVNRNMLYKPHINQCPLVSITNEVWSSAPVQLELESKIVITNNTDKSYIYKLNNKLNELYEWNYMPVSHDFDIHDITHIEPIMEHAIYSNVNCYPVFVLLYHSGTIMSNVVKLFSRGNFSHVSLSFSPSLDPHYSFGGRSLYTRSVDDMGFTSMNILDKFYRVYKTKYELYVMYVNKTTYDNMVSSVNMFIKQSGSLKYDITNLLWTYLGYETDSSPKYFCTKFVAKIINLKNRLSNKPASLWMPDDFKSINNITLVNKGDDLSKYDVNTTLINLNYIKHNNYGSIKFSYTPKEVKQLLHPLAEYMVIESEEEYIPEDNIFEQDKTPVYELLQNTSYEHIYLTSDWHLFKNHYKKERNLVNTAKIVKWCQEHLKENDVFMYLGDISYRFASDEDLAACKDIFQSIKCKKILILGNHDMMLGEKFFRNCGFDYVMEELEWNNIIFTHKPIDSVVSNDKINIHGHLHQRTQYYTTDGKNNINVYPYFYNNKPVTLEYLISHKNYLVRDNEQLPHTTFPESTGIAHHLWVSSLDNNFTPKDKLFLSQFIRRYITTQDELDHFYDDEYIREVDLDSEDCVVWTDIDNNLVAFISISKPNLSDVVWLMNIEISPEYRGHGLCKQILDYAINALNVKALCVRNTNKLTIDIYEKYGFNTDEYTKLQSDSGHSNWYAMYYGKYNPIINTSILSRMNASYNSIGIQHEATNNISKVYFSKVINEDTILKLVNKYKSKLTGDILIKLHFGERGNKNILDPKLLTKVAKEYNAVLGDCNTAYGGSRDNTESHLKVIKEHNFNQYKIDILDSEDCITIGVSNKDKINKELNKIKNREKPAYESLVTVGKHLDSISIGSHLGNYDSMIAYTHFKGPGIGGVGGSIKNIGMGCASGEKGKKQIHNKDFSCIGSLFMERLTESTNSIIDYFDNKVVYVNVLANISLMCDCDKDATPPIINDIGVLVSDDIIAIEQASLDLIRQNPKSKELIEQISDKGAYRQIEYANWLGMGNKEYSLIDINDKPIKVENTIYASSMYLYDEQSINKNDIEKYDPNFKSKDNLSLSSFKMVNIKDEKTINRITDGFTSNASKKYIKELKMYYRWFTSENNKSDRSMEYIIWLDNNELVAYVLIQKFNDGVNYLTPMVISPTFRGHGLSKQIMDLLIDKYNINELTVDKDNKVAINLYKKYGFTFTNKYKGDSNQLFMTLNQNK